MECCSTKTACDVSLVPGLSNTKKPDSAFCTSNGVFLFVATDGKLFVYNTKTNELIKVVINQNFEFKHVHLCPNDRYVAVRNEHGGVFIFTVSKLLTHTSIAEEELTPYRSFSSHREAVRGLCFSRFDSRFLLTVGLDHRMIVTEVETDRVALKVDVDIGLTACAMTPTDSTIFCGTENGRVIVIPVSRAVEYAKKSDVVRNGVVNGTANYSVYDKHGGSSIIAMTVNLDGSRLASGDSNGLIVIWDAFNGQMLSKHQQPEATSNLRFVMIPRPRTSERTVTATIAIPVGKY